MSHQPPPHGHGHGHGHPAYANYQPQNPPMLIHQFHPQNPQFFVHPQSQMLGNMPQYVAAQPNLANVMHNPAAAAAAAAVNHTGIYPVRQVFHSNNYGGFNGNAAMMIPHAAPPTATMIMRPPPRMNINDMESLQPNKTKTYKPHIPGIPLAMPPPTATAQIPFLEAPPPKLMYHKPNKPSSAIKIVNPDTGEDVVELYRKERETSRSDESTGSACSIVLTVPDIIDKHDKFNNHKVDDTVAPPDLLNQTGFANTSLNLSFIQSEEEDLNASNEHDPTEVVDKFEIKNLLRRPDNEVPTGDHIAPSIAEAEPHEEVETVESSVCGDDEDDEPDDGVEFSEEIDVVSNGAGDDAEIEVGDEATEEQDEEDVPTEPEGSVKVATGVQAVEQKDTDQNFDISTETISDEEMFDDEMDEELAPAASVNKGPEIDNRQPEMLPSIVDEVAKIDLNTADSSATTKDLAPPSTPPAPPKPVVSVESTAPTKLTNHYTKESTPTVAAAAAAAATLQDSTGKCKRKQKAEYSMSKLLELRNTPLAKKKPTSIPMNVFMLVQKSDLPKMNMGGRGPQGLGYPHQQNNLMQLFPKFAREHQQFNPQQQYFPNAAQLQKKHPQFQNANIVHNFPKPVIRLSLSKEVKLNVSENAWKPRHVVENVQHKRIDEDQTTKIEKNFRSILNKLTPENFNVLLDQVRDLAIDNQDRLERCIILLFEKAISEPLFAPCYANLCQEIATMYVPHKEKEKVTFRYILVHHCQKEFEKHRTDRTKQQDKGKKLLEAAQDDKNKLAELQQELQEENNKIRHRAVGTIRFIGELYKIEMLKSHIMMECVKILWEFGDTKSLECLCKLLTTIGKSMEEKGYRDHLGEYFDKLEDVIERKTIVVETRIRFMIMDLLDLRKKNWRPRQPAINPTPLTQQYRN